MKSLMTIVLGLFASIALAASTSGTVETTAAQSLTDAAGTVWTLNPTAPCTATWATAGTVGEVSRNGVLDPTTCQVIELAYVNGVVWQLTVAGNWYPMTASGGWGTSQTASPLSAVVAPVSYTETLTWSAVTANLDGSIPASITYSVYSGPTVTSLAATPIATGITAVTASYSIGSAGATVCFAVSATNDAGVESAQSAIGCKTFSKPVPSAPTNLVVK